LSRQVLGHLLWQAESEPHPAMQVLMHALIPMQVMGLFPHVLAAQLLTSV